MPNEKNSELIKKGICPLCGSNLVFREACVECMNCGWTSCPEG